MYIEEPELDNSLLYQVWTDSPDEWRHFEGFFDGDYCPDIPDPYPFVIGALPGWFLDKHPHPYRSGGADYWSLLTQEGVDSLVWRRQPTHIAASSFLHPTLFSSELLETMETLSPGLWTSDYSFSVVGPTERTRLRYHWVTPAVEVEVCPEVETTPDGFDFDSPLAFRRSEFRKRERFGVTETKIAVQGSALPFGIFRTKEFGFTTLLTSAAFIRTWRKTDISQRLMRAHFEDDFFFVPFEPHPGVGVQVVE